MRRGMQWWVDDDTVRLIYRHYRDLVWDLPDRILGFDFVIRHNVYGDIGLGNLL